MHCIDATLARMILAPAHNRGTGRALLVRDLINVVVDISVEQVWITRAQEKGAELERVFAAMQEIGTTLGTRGITDFGTVSRKVFDWLVDPMECEMEDVDARLALLELVLPGEFGAAGYDAQVALERRAAQG
ncbi:hypothetical protein LTR36_001280 [Oleoguttula mirabilis]|uniref:Uncharacterized protein n=1 Tax=Oleoguttula mirabilis TaxID=1507867 RepID=A0AAV9JNV4_9PEZI|nr:hypothetical protein LTR36_001280 [Oleoguttula mirabilis]